MKMKHLYGLNPCAPEFVPKVILTGPSRAFPENVSLYSTIGFPHSRGPSPMSSTVSTSTSISAFSSQAAFHSQSFSGASHLLQSQLHNSVHQSRSNRPRILSLTNKTAPYTTSRQGGMLNTPVLNSTLSNLNQLNNSPLTPLNGSFHGLQISGSFSTNGHNQDNNMHRSFDFSYPGPANSETTHEVLGPARRAISKPLTVQQLEATLLKEATVMSLEEDSWTVSPNNNNPSAWTPLSGLTLWEGIVPSKQDGKSDSVPLYLRTANTNTHFSDDDADLSNDPFSMKVEEADSHDEGSLAIPSWADGIFDFHEDLEVKSLIFEKSVLQMLRNENAVD